VREVLLHCIVDSRECPKCHHYFVPTDMAAKEAQVIRTHIKDLMDDTLNKVNPLYPGKITVEKPGRCASGLSMLMKPPLGVMPQRIWKEQRIMDLSRAIHEYAGLSNLAGDPGLLVKWSAELLQLTSELAADRKVQP
jgi:hypothetical protein